MPERLVKKTNAERLANEPGVQMQDEEPAILMAVPIQDIKTLLQQHYCSDASHCTVEPLWSILHLRNTTQSRAVEIFMGKAAVK
jgi:hypothetical protein